MLRVLFRLWLPINNSFCLLFIFGSACQSTDNKEPFAHIPAPLHNPITSSGVVLGKYLFFDNTLSIDGDLSCASCHIPSRAFASNAPTAASHKSDAPPLNVPPLFNLAWHNTFFYSGGGKNLESAVLMPIINNKEMAANFETVLLRLNRNYEVRSLAKAAFDVDTLNAALVSKAMAQYLRTITSFQCRLDTFLASNDSSLLSSTELKGLSIFTAHCATCHPHPLYTDLDFHHVVRYNISDGADNRRALVSRKIADTNKIKTPTLRNLKYTYPYGHTGKFSTLNEIIRAHRLRTVLTDEQIDHLVIFLNTLNDKSLINSPN